MYANYSEYGNKISTKDETINSPVKVELYNIDGEEAFKQLLSIYKSF